MIDENEHTGEKEIQDSTDEGTLFVKKILEKTREMKKVDCLDEEIARMAEKNILITLHKHINLWRRQLEMKRNW